MTSSEATAEHGFDYESPDDVGAATVAGMVDGSLTVVRGACLDDCPQPRQPRRRG